MSKERFERLRQSLIETGQVLRGDREPSREFIYEIDSPQPDSVSETVWAICVTDEDDALIPLKLYEIKLSKTSYISVVDEEGEKLLCPANWFIPVRLAPEVRQQVAKLVS